MRKLFQWLLPSRFLLILYITICAVAMTFLEWPLATKWYALLAVLFITFLMAMPEGEISRKFRSAFWSLPILVVTSSMSHITRIFKRKRKERQQNENRHRSPTHFRKDKHGMDFVILETLKELQKRKDGNEYYVFVAPGEDWCLEESENLHIIELRCPTYPCGSR